MKVQSFKLLHAASGPIVQMLIADAPDCETASQWIEFSLPMADLPLDSNLQDIQATALRRVQNALAPGNLVT